jgi:hypothetical protein
MGRLHIVFGDSAAGTLKQVLHGVRSADSVISLGDDLSWGPIGRDNLETRIGYFDQYCPIPDGWAWLAQAHEDFANAAGGPWDERLIWLGSGSARELAGYLFYLDRFAHFPAEVVRPDDYLLPHPRFGPAGSIGVLNASDLADVLKHAPRKPVSDDEQLRGRWDELLAEGAELRVLIDATLESAPVDRFDHLILDVLGPDWKVGVRAIGDALGAAFDMGVQINSDFLFSRLSRLVRCGTLEAEGDVLGWTEDMRRLPIKVRKPAA